MNRVLARVGGRPDRFTVAASRHALERAERVPRRAANPRRHQKTPSVSYNKGEIAALKDPAEAAAYLNAAIEHGDRGDLPMALRDVAEATGGMRRLAGKTGIPRERLYRSLSGRGNLGYATLTTVLRALGLAMHIESVRGSGATRLDAGSRGHALVVREARLRWVRHSPADRRAKVKGR
jgi:probable addiction module antidote protein